MKTLEKNEKLWQTERQVHTKLLISLLLIALEKHTWSHIKVTANTWAIFFTKNRIFSFFDIL